MQRIFSCSLCHLTPITPNPSPNKNLLKRGVFPGQVTPESIFKTAKGIKNYLFVHGGDHLATVSVQMGEFHKLKD